MFYNLLYQSASTFLASDIKSGKLPQAILLSGPGCSGKLTCALEIARILSCANTGKKGDWNCECPSCKKNKELQNTQILLAGYRDCSLEISAARKTLLYAEAENASYLTAARYLFARAVRKLTMRFSQVLLEGDDRLSKIAPYTQSIDENLERLSFANPLPESSELEKITADIIKSADKLESSFLSDSVPVDQIRNASSWARLKSAAGKKVFIIENADRMLESCRNALLKILEEPPQDTVFILTTTNKGAIMPTILSRVRVYNFVERKESEQAEVIKRVFHDFSSKHSSIEKYLQSFLPVSPEKIKKTAEEFYEGIQKSRLFQVSYFVKECASFNPSSLFKIFLSGLLDAQKSFDCSSACLEVQTKNIEAIKNCYNNVTIYNQSPQAALEKLCRDLAANKRMFA